MSGPTRRKVQILFAGTILSIAAMGVYSQQLRDRSFWLDGDDWHKPTHCIICGATLERLDDTFVGCLQCKTKVLQAAP